MNIGLFDQDLQNLGLCAPNIQLMKLATYYKQRRNLVGFMPTLGPDYYSQYYYFQDYPGKTNIDVLSNKNCIAGGYELIHGYKKLPLEIEKCIPDTSIYLPHYQKLSSDYDKKIGTRLMKIEHMMLSLDGTTIWKDYPTQFKNHGKSRAIMFHDKDLNKINGSYNEIQKILEYRLDNNLTSIAVKYPIKVYNVEELIKWCNLRTTSHLFLLEINFFLDTKYNWQAFNLTNKNITYRIDSFCNNQREFINKCLPDMCRQVMNFSRKWNEVLLTYTPGFFKDKRMIKLIMDFNSYLFLKDENFITLEEFLSYPQFKDSKSYLMEINPIAYNLCQ